MLKTASALAQAMHHHQAGRLDEAEALYRLVLQENPADGNALAMLGVLSHQAGKNNQAIALLRQAIALFPEGAIFHANLGAIYASLARWEEAAAAYEQAVRFRPMSPQDRVNLGSALQHLGRLTEAEACYQQALQLQPDNQDALTFLSSALMGRGQATQAEALWRRALAIRPESVPAWEGLADIFLAQQNWASLEQVARQVGVLAGPASAAPIRALGHMARREFDEARVELDRAIHEQPTVVRPRMLMAFTWLHEDRDAKAAENALLDVLALDPVNTTANRSLVRLLQRRPRPGESSLGGPDTLRRLYQAVCTVPSEINEHCPTIYELARNCRHITEFGTRLGISTTALLYAQPAALVCYDKVKHERIELLEALAGSTTFVFHQADVLEVDIEPTELLFIDTWHVYDQLKQELARHAVKARKYIVLHDTTTFFDQGESEGHLGLWPAIVEFLHSGTFCLKQRYLHNNGLTVLERI